MKEFILNEFAKKEVVINCKTKEEAEDFISFLLSRGFKWYRDSTVEDDEGNLIEEPFWDYYKENTCYICKDGEFIDFCDIIFYKENFTKILPLSHITKGNKVGVVRSVSNNWQTYLKEIIKVFPTEVEAKAYVKEIQELRDLEIGKELEGKTEDEIDTWWEENEWYNVYNIVPIKE